MVELPLMNRQIPIIADEYVDMEFGTGVVKITPAHDPNDFEVGLRHNLAVINVLTDDAKIVDDYPKYAGMDRYEARKAIVEDLKAEGALVEIEDYSHNVGTCYRCHTTVEPRVSLQWFVKMEDLAKPAIEAVKSKETKFVPEHFDKTYYHWLENIKDWCISRQLWWGHRIPAFYCDDCNETVVTKDAAPVCPKCGKPMRQDPDTLDTWFSSALWPFSTLGWPDKTEDFEYFYPTSTLVTGYDIILFWVIRMMFSGIEHTGKAPFNTVLIHGLVRDSQGRKMSKSLGNFFTVRDISEKYDLQVLRFFMLSAHYRSPLNFSAELMEAAKNGLERILTCAQNLQYRLEHAANSHMTEEESRLYEQAVTYVNRFDEAMDDDFNTADAISVIFELVKFINSNTGEESSKAYLQNLYEELKMLTDICGLLIEPKQELLDADIEKLIQERQDARKQKNFARADELRNELLEKGIVLEDTREGVKWKRA